MSKFGRNFGVTHEIYKRKLQENCMSPKLILGVFLVTKHAFITSLVVFSFSVMRVSHLNEVNTVGCDLLPMDPGSPSENGFMEPKYFAFRFGDWTPESSSHKLIGSSDKLIVFDFNILRKYFGQFPHYPFQSQHLP